MTINRKYIENIIAANNDNSLAIFVGAGISKTSDTKTSRLPTWKDIIDGLKSDLNTPDETDYLRIAQLYHLAFGEYTYYKRLKDYFQDNIPPSKIHKQIFEINPHVVITTNWDNILEKAIEENAYIYDLVCSDIDLVKSTLQNKLIKMHGDFKNHNLVFKEDDYINYQFNFPLIENYIKSIISTHTVLFLGYSYSDLDLKQIVKWIQNYSRDVRPPMYLVTFDRDLNQMKYLENHGITTIVLDESDSIDDSIQDDPYFDTRSKRMYSFLSRIRNNNQILHDPKQVAKFVLSRIEPLNQLNGILIEQVQNVLSNCGFLFDDDSKPIIEFYNDRLTLDINKAIREIYAKFVELLQRVDQNEKPSVEVLKIFEILEKARIKGVVLSKNNVKDHKKEYIPIAQYITVEDDTSLDYLFNFDFESKDFAASELNSQFDLVFKYHNLGKNEEAFALIEDVIAKCLKQRSYMWLFVAMYNRNVLLDYLKFYSYNKDYAKYLKYEKYDLKERYHLLTKDSRAALEPIYEFVDFTFIYRYAYNVSKDLKKTEEAKSTVEAGGVVLHSDVHKFSARHENLVSFVLKNKILIEDYEEYKTINKAFVKIALMRQILNDSVTLSKIELYSCIKYIKYKELQDLFEDFFDDSSKHKGKLYVTDELKGWLINEVLVNVANQYLQDESDFRRIENYLENIIFILALLKHDEKCLDKVLVQVGRIVEKGRNSIGLFQCINMFFAIQHSLFKQEIKDKTIRNLIETLVLKFIHGKFSANEFHAITRNDLYNLYGYARLQNVIINNDELISKLLPRVNEYPVEDKINITQGLLFSLYDISSQSIKDKIKAFALDLDTTIEDDNIKHTRLIYELTLVIRGFKDLSDDLILELDQFLEPYKTGTRFSSVLYTISRQLEYLIKEKSLDSLSSVALIVNDSIARHKERDSFGIF